MLITSKFQEDKKDTFIPINYSAERRKKSYQAREKRSLNKEIVRTRRDFKINLINRSKKKAYRFILKNLEQDSEKICLSRAYLKALTKSDKEFLPTLTKLAEEDARFFIRANKKKLHDILKVIYQDKGKVIEHRKKLARVRTLER